MESIANLKLKGKILEQSEKFIRYKNNSSSVSISIASAMWHSLHHITSNI